MTFYIKDYETYYRGEEEPFITRVFIILLNILILDYNISIFQYIYLTLSLHLPFFIALSLYCSISVFQYLSTPISLYSNISLFQYLSIPISIFKLQGEIL